MRAFGCIGVVLALATLLGVGHAAPNPCEDQDRICNETQYEEYRQCIEESKAIRRKRQTLCEQLAQLQEGGTAMLFDASQSDESVVVLPSVQVIPALESVKTVEPIDSNDIPELDPPSIALKTLNRKVIIQGDDEDEEYEYQVPTNVTTVIRLTNVVNNTNVVNVPTHVNTTNVNNIHIYSNITGVGDDVPVSGEQEEKCCTAVRPKTCHASTQGFKCQHKKFRTCGPQCTSKIVHVQRRKRCDREGNCKEKLAYVPQPEKPKCVYIDQWPFVACGKPANMEVICDGCYDHYGYGYDSFNGPVPPQCRGCYDDAFDQGPLYRRGPVMQPFYYHEPPCYITGSCPPAYGDCGYGCFGHQMVDPAWGYQPSPYDPPLDSSNTGYFDEDPVSINGTDTDWGVPVHKCTVVSDDNTISVQNCTSGVDNQYAAAPSSYPYYNPVQYPAQRPSYKVKQTIVQQRQHQQPRLDELDAASGFGSDNVAFVVDDEEDYDFDQ